MNFIVFVLILFLNLTSCGLEKKEDSAPVASPISLKKGIAARAAESFRNEAEQVKPHLNVKFNAYLDYLSIENEEAYSVKDTEEEISKALDFYIKELESVETQENMDVLSYYMVLEFEYILEEPKAVQGHRSEIPNLWESYLGCQQDCQKAAQRDLSLVLHPNLPPKL